MGTKTKKRAITVQSVIKDLYRVVERQNQSLENMAQVLVDLHLNVHDLHERIASLELAGLKPSLQTDPELIEMLNDGAVVANGELVIEEETIL